MARGGALAPGVLYGGVDGPLFHGGSLMPTLSAASPSLDSTGAAPSASAQDPPPIALSCAEDLDLVRCVGDLGHAVSPTGGGHAIFPASSSWGGASLHLVLHQKPSALLYAVQTSSRLPGRSLFLTIPGASAVDALAASPPRVHPPCEIRLRVHFQHARGRGSPEGQRAKESFLKDFDTHKMRLPDSRQC
ncbi:unnamed protein product [Miscanthus lutarioriparius]|uniref:Uncharacterized protein n=1 Tax=Miscanthus lutarioriparius TaxID=422564 RepID=A0A811S9G8_9POAL|nr:unnamed protein product [Miscanthus lutarioriparius]